MLLREEDLFKSIESKLSKSKKKQKGDSKMIKFCSKCGAQIDDMKFCPKCGAKAEEVSDNNQIKNTVNTVDTNKLLPLITVTLFPIVYIISLLSEWFEVDIPYLGNYSMHMYEMFGKFNDVFNYLDEGAAEVFCMTFIVALLVLAVIVLYKSLRGAYLYFIKNSYDSAVRSIAQAALLSIVIGVISILTVWIVRGVLKADDDELSRYIGGVVGDMIGFTKAPVILLISGIIGKVVADKSTYIVSKLK